MASESMARCRALAKTLADELGLPFVEEQIPTSATISFCAEGRRVKVLSAGYFERMEGGPMEVGARLCDIIEGVRAAKSMVRAGRFIVEPNGAGGYRVDVKAVLPPKAMPK